MSLKLQTPFLRMIVWVFSYVGIHFVPVEWNNLASLVHLTWNMSIDGLVLYGLCTVDMFGPAILGDCTDTKPLFAFFSKLCIVYLYPATFTMNILYYMWYGPQLIGMIDSACLYKYYHSKRHATRIMLILIVVIHASYIMFITNARDPNWPIGTFLLSCVAAYIINLYQFSVCLILHYYQHATHRLLKQIESKVSRKVLSIEEDQALEEVAALALTNYSLNQLLSLPLIVYIVLNVFNFILITCTSIICEFNPSFMLYNSVIWAYLTYLAWLNHNIRFTLKHICERLKRNYDIHDGDGQGRIFRIVSQQPSKSHYYSPSGLTAQHSRMMRFSQIDLYVQYFPIKMFHFTKMSFPFMLQTVLFILNYVVLMTQTN